jgi:predicted phosphodiesterase
MSSVVLLERQQRRRIECSVGRNGTPADHRRERAMSTPNADIPGYAAISDIHGNRWALEAVLYDIHRRGISQVVNLGDHLTGPLDPVGTAELLLTNDMVNICGNDDRDLFAPEEDQSLSRQYTYPLLLAAHREWLRALPETATVGSDLFLCHGDRFDTPYLLEHISPSGVSLRPVEKIVASVTGIEYPVILSGHSHVPRVVILPDGRVVANPGSVGLPAYTMETPFHHAMEAGSPHARYAVVSQRSGTWNVELVAVPYDWKAAAGRAQINGRTDWALWLSTGRTTS